MPRNARIIIPGVPHHITQRGNYGRTVFFSDKDTSVFLEQLYDYSTKAKLQLACYCLMPNHTHLIVIPEQPDSVWRTFKPLHMRLSQRLNRRFDQRGINWQGRFFSSPMDEIHTFRAFQYVCLNPVRAGLVSRIEEYRWSSAKAHLGLADDPNITANKIWREMATNALAEALRTGLLDAPEFSLLRRNTSTNLPTGADQFIKMLERTTGRSLSYRPPGRPAKTGNVPF